MQEYFYPKSPLPIRDTKQAQAVAYLWNGGHSCPLYKFGKYGTMDANASAVAVASLEESLQWAIEDGAGEDAIEIQNLITFLKESMPCSTLH